MTYTSLITTHIRVEYEITPIRHIAIKCPGCSSYFDAKDITEKHIKDIIDAQCADYSCPLCHTDFRADDSFTTISECNSADEVYKDVKRQTWQ